MTRSGGVGVGAALVTGWFVVVGAGVVAEVLRFSGREGAWTNTFSLTLEGNIPTWYSSVLLAFCALALFTVGRDHAAPDLHSRSRWRWRWHWRGLAVVFAAISMDEVAGFHERINQTAHFGGVLYYAWVIPFGALVVVIAILWLPLLAALPMPTRRRFVAAALLYVGGALGVELVLGAWASAHGPMNLTYRMIDAVEEGAEIAGASLFLWSLLAHRAALAEHDVRRVAE